MKQALQFGRSPILTVSSLLETGGGKGLLLRGCFGGSLFQMALICLNLNPVLRAANRGGKKIWNFTQKFIFRTFVIIHKY